MYNTDITNPELIKFHNKIKITGIYNPETNEMFYNDGLKYFPLFNFDRIVDATDEMRILGDGRCIINPDEYVHFESDSKLAKKVRTEENPLLKSIGDSLSLEEFNYLVYYLRTFCPTTDIIEINKNNVLGESGEYDFNWNNAVLLDEGVLITEANTVLGTVTLNNPAFANSEYILNLKIVNYEKTNIDTGDTEPITISAVEVPLKYGVPVDIEFEDVEVNNIVSYDAKVVIDHNKPYVKLSDYILFNSDKSSYYLDENIVLTAKYLDGYNTPVSDVEITFKQGNTVLGTSTTDNDGIATYTLEATTVGDYTYSALYDEISSENISVTIVNPVDTVVLSTNKSVAVKNTNINLTAKIVGIDGNPLIAKEVTFKQGTTNIGSATTDITGEATLTYKTTTNGIANFTATCKGITSDAISVKTKTNNTVLWVHTEASPNPVAVNQDVTVTVTVTDLDDEPVPQEPVKNGSGTVLGKTDAYGVFKQILQFSTPGQYPLQFKAGTHNGGITITVTEN